MIRFNGYNIEFSDGKLTIKAYPNEKGIFIVPLKAVDLVGVDEVLKLEAFAESEQISIIYK